MYVNRRNFRVLKEIGAEEHDGDVRYFTGSGNTDDWRMRNEKYAILFMAKLPKFSRHLGNLVEEDDGDVRFCTGSENIASFFIFYLHLSRRKKNYLLTYLLTYLSIY